MARSRHRMRSRHGGTRGGITRPQASSSTATASLDSSADNPNPLSSFYGRYPETQSGRGCTRLQGIGRRDAATNSTNFPLPPHPAPHVTQFQFRSTLTRPVITATVTISFSEEIDPQAPPPEHKDEQNRAAPRNCGINIPDNQQHDDGKAALHGKAVAGSQPAVDSKHGNTKASGSRQGETSAMPVGIGSIAADHAGSEEYGWCLVIEEEPIEDTLQLLANGKF